MMTDAERAALWGGYWFGVLAGTVASALVFRRRIRRGVYR